MWQKVLLVAVGGAFGAVARFALTVLADRIEGVATVAGTVAANAIGCLIFGVVASLMMTRYTLGHAASLLILTGFCGAMTTFSAYAFETHAYARDYGPLWAGGYLIMQNTLGLSLLVLGLWLGRWMAGS